ncbi:MAG: Cysteine protease atg4 [Pycnora praestabilis]|nr:MAG: Cysteine protease atg4 [Pycnora praestabilis]
MGTVELGRYKRIVQYFWDPEPKNDDTLESPIWCLGRQYITVARRKHEMPAISATVVGGLSSESADSNISESTTLELNTERSVNKEPSLECLGEGNDDSGGWPPSFLDDFESRIWLTYRSNFPPIAKSQNPNASSAMSFSVRLRSHLVDQGGFTSDTGWGCMIRSGQSLLANALVMLKLGRDWRKGHREDEERHIISLFADDPRAPFSVHRFVSHGASACGKHPGEWFGPSATARCIEALSDGYRATDLRIYVTGDGCDVYEDRFRNIAVSKNGEFLPTLVLVGIRLGIDRVTPVYWEALKASLQLRQSIGIAGGRPSSSHYFLGVQGSYFFYLDPHQTRPALPWHDRPNQYATEDIASCHTRRLRRIHVQEMDPSMLIGFLIRDEDDWKAWRYSIGHVPGKAVIHVADEEPTLHGRGSAREGAVDEVETFDDDDDDVGLAATL